MPFRSAVCAFVLSLLAAMPLSAAPIDTAARNAILVDLTSGAVLMSKKPDEPFPPASMIKLMTIFMVFEALDSGRLTLDDEFTVSEKAWKTGGSKMFVKVGERISVDDLLRGVIIQSGNDACVVLAEGLAGSEREFARRMTQRGKEMGLENSRFENATGLPAEGQRMSARDLSILAEQIIKDFPELYKRFSEREFVWEGITQRNRNPLLRLDIGGDGLKTGHTEEAGYCLTGSAIQGERRLVAVIAGLPSVEARAVEIERILKWGFREFETTEVLGAGATVGAADVWIGEADTVPLVVEDPLFVTTGFGQGDAIEAELRYQGPVEAPIEAGQRLGTLRVSAPGIEPVDVPLLAGEAVARGGFVVKLKSTAMMMLGRGVDALMGRGSAPATE